LLAAEVCATTWDFHDKLLVTRTPRSRSSSSLPMGLPFTAYSWIKGDLFRVTVRQFVLSSLKFNPDDVDHVLRLSKSFCSKFASVWFLIVLNSLVSSAKQETEEAMTVSCISLT
jgi:hypothetical protein